MTRHRARVRPRSPQPVEAPDEPLVSSEPHKRPDTAPGPAMVGKCAAHSKTRLTTTGHLDVEQISESTLFSWLRWLVVDGAPKTRQQEAELAHRRMRTLRHHAPASCITEVHWCIWQATEDKKHASASCCHHSAVGKRGAQPTRAQHVFPLCHSIMSSP